MNRCRSLLFSALAVASLALLGPSGDARACGVLTPDQTIPVTGHKMILSLSMSQTTLWDQFTYTGDPASFGWILPIKGQVEVGVSSDALFDAFGQVTAPQIYAPAICPNSCDGNGGGSAGGGSAGGGDPGGNVTVIAHEQVGPYDTVQLASNDPTALSNWLQANGFPVPAPVKPVFDTFVSEGFGFLAIKLLPGVGTEAVQPVRVTMPGAAPSVPIRLLAAGTGDLTQVSLWVVSDGKYLPDNAPVVRILSSDLTWDFATDGSDYAAVRAAKLAASGGLAYLVEQSQPHGTFEFTGPIGNLVLGQVTKSGYGKTPAEAQAAWAADEDKMFGTFIAAGTLPWVTRLSADLSRDGLKEDLSLSAAANQIPESGVYDASNYINEGECPPDPCGGSGGVGGTGGVGGSGGGTGAGGPGGSGGGMGGSGGGAGGSGGQGANANAGGTEDCGCRLPGSSSSDTGAALGLVVALGLAARARRRLARR